MTINKNKHQNTHIKQKTYKNHTFAVIILMYTNVQKFGVFNVFKEKSVLLAKTAFI